MSTIKERKAAQGYCNSVNAPACSNCQRKTGLSMVARCSFGDFEVTSSGWCPFWQPAKYWITNNPSANALLKN